MVCIHVRVYVDRSRERVYVYSIGEREEGERAQGHSIGKRERDGERTAERSVCVRSIGRVYHQTASVVTAIVPTTSPPDPASVFRHFCFPLFLSPYSASPSSLYLLVSLSPRYLSPSATIILLPHSTHPPNTSFPFRPFPLAACLASLSLSFFLALSFCSVLFSLSLSLAVYPISLQRFLSSTVLFLFASKVLR